MEARSHQDRIILTIDDSTRQLVGSAEKISNNIASIGSGISAISGQLNSIGGAITEGFDELSFQLGLIDQGVDRLGSICEAGFELINSSMLHSNSLLTKLVSLLETPEEIWAKEQYDNALHCVENELWHEAIEYCDKAIEGDGRHSGYKLEPVYHFLRGTILIGGAGADPKLIDLKRAFMDFQNCARYCGKKNPKLQHKATNNSAWVKYCEGEVGEAIDILNQLGNKGVETEGLSSRFLLSKCYIHLGELSKAKDCFKAATEHDELYAVRAKNDPDFINHCEDVEHWIDEVRQDLGARIENELVKVVSPSKLEEFIIFAEKEEVSTSELKKFIAEYKSISEVNCQLSDRVRFVRNYLSTLPIVIGKLVSKSLNELEIKAKSIEPDRVNTPPGLDIYVPSFNHAISYAMGGMLIGSFWWTIFQGSYFLTLVKFGGVGVILAFFKEIITGYSHKNSILMSIEKQLNDKKRASQIRDKAKSFSDDFRRILVSETP